MDVRLDTSLELLVQAPCGLRAPGVLATIVATAGSTYQKPGARMLIRHDGSYLGLLSGGCLEADLAQHAQQVLADGQARSIDYDYRGPDDLLYGMGAGCEGAMRILLEPAGPDHPVAAANSARTPVLICVHESGDLPLGTYAPAAAGNSGPGVALPPALLTAAREVAAARASRELDLASGGGRTRAFLQYLAPPPHLLVCGAGPDAQPVVGAARALYWRVSVVDHRPAYAQALRFPGAQVLLGPAAQLGSLVPLEDCHAAIVMSHHLTSDAAYLRALAEAGTPGYVGLLGPAIRRQRLAVELGTLGDRLRGRLRGPVGLNIGAVTPEGIALAITAQIHAWLARPVHCAVDGTPA
jgi:xanthine dehydrogenase accessory factor